MDIAEELYRTPTGRKMKNGDSEMKRYSWKVKRKEHSWTEMKPWEYCERRWNEVRNYVRDGQWEKNDGNWGRWNELKHVRMGREMVQNHRQDIAERICWTRKRKKIARRKLNSEIKGTKWARWSGAECTRMRGKIFINEIGKCEWCWSKWEGKHCRLRYIVCKNSQGYTLE